jgi:hypothetical protein
MQDKEILPIDNIRSKIHTIRGMQVILDRDLANLYNVETKILNKAVKRNIERFPDKFMFQLNKKEMKDWKFQFGTSNSEKMGLRKLPYAFTEHGVVMLSSVLRSKKAIEINIIIIDAFITMRHFLKENSNVFQKFQQIDQKFVEYDDNFNKLFQAIENNDIKPKQGIFYNGQIFDAYKFVCDLIKSAKESIILIDNYIDETILDLFTKANKDIIIKIYTKEILKLDLDKYNKQYNNIELKKFNLSHDRFLIIDNKEIFHIGASLKDLGKKWFAFSKFEKDSINLIEKLD